MLSFNKAQHAAITAEDGPALVLAGAGSGKTRVIVEHIVWLIHERGVDPRNILALTFTNKAAGEMRSRVVERLGTERLASWVGTFHSFGLFLLRREIEHLGRKKSFTIFDDSDQLSLMKRLVKDLPGRWEKVSPREALTWVSDHKQKLHKPSDDVDYSSSVEETYHELWGRYHERLLKASAVDFDDLLVLPARLLDAHEDVRAKYQRRYRYVLIDEYQDTNHAQYWIAKRLSEEHGNIFAVGDEDQSIYSWRGADLNNILEFEKDFADATIYRLEQNYRSTKPILAAANSVVSHNVERLGKTLWTRKDEGEKVAFYEAPDAQGEARFVAEQIKKGDFPPKEIAVLYRTNGQARAMEEELRKKGIAYKVVGGIKFYARKEIKDLLAYLRLLVNPDDDESLRRIINVPRRGIGAETLRKLSESAALRQSSLLQALRDVEGDQMLSPRMRAQIGELVHLLDDLSLSARNEPVPVIIEELVEKIGYREYVEKSDEKDFKVRLEIVEEFISSCAEHDESAVLEFLQDLSLVSDVDSLDEALPAVTLMTCHSAKGLEFDCIFLVGLEEGLLPHASSLASDKELEEERRLCYVAMTRARKRLFLTKADSRMVYGETRDCETSRFVGEIPGSMIENVVERQPARKAIAKSSGPKADTQAIRTGVCVRHASFGRGYVMYTKGSGTKLRARIRFDTGRTREFIVGMAPLEIVEKRRR